VHNFISSIIDHDLHAKRVASLADATVGLLRGAQLAVSTLGRALAVGKNRDPKHAIKQVDRFFSNTGVDVWQLAANWVPFVIGSRPEIVAALDWTIAASLLTLLGVAGEAIGLDRRMRANTSKERVLSLLNQGLFYFDWLLTMSDERARSLMQKFEEPLRQQATFREIFGLI
jgi:hypothetical protein